MSTSSASPTIIEGDCRYYEFSPMVGDMKNQQKFSWSKRGMAFVYAWHGLIALLRYEHNARLHVIAALVAILLGFLLCISPLEWCAILICIGMVISAEALNSGIEAIADRLTEEPDPLIGRAKDYGAAAVTLLAFAAAAVGAIIFIPKVMELL